MVRRLEEGVYEELVTAGLAALIGLADVEVQFAQVDPAEGPELLAGHLEKVAARVLAGLLPDRRLEVVNDILAQLMVATARATAEDLVDTGPRLLLAVGGNPPRPQNPLRRADLLINARHEPALHEELAAELASADQVDLLCAFIKWQGLRLLLDADSKPPARRDAAAGDHHDLRGRHRTTGAGRAGRSGRRG